jgi:zinc finger protein
MTEKSNDAPDVLNGQPCPICHKNALTLMERQTEVPYFGNLLVFSMSCRECKFHKADVECTTQKDPCKYTLEIQKEDDIKARIIKGSQATVKIPHITTITPGPASNGYVTNVEGIFNRVKHQIEHARDAAEDNAEKKKAKNLLKKITKIMWGQEKQKIIIEDPSGNSAIIHDRVEVKKL